MRKEYDMNKLKWLQTDQDYVKKEYFIILKIADTYCEVMSRNTKHCWIISKSLLENRPVILYHKHSKRYAYYHKQWEAFDVEQAVKSIMRHDAYVLKYAYH